MDALWCITYFIINLGTYFIATSYYSYYVTNKYQIWSCTNHIIDNLKISPFINIWFIIYDNITWLYHNIKLNQKQRKYKSSLFFENFFVNDNQKTRKVLKLDLKSRKLHLWLYYTQNKLLLNFSKHYQTKFFVGLCTFSTSKYILE